jgi:uncharacterized protein
MSSLKRRLILYWSLVLENCFNKCRTIFKKKYGIQCLFIADDLVHHTVPHEIYQMCKEKWLQINYLVNNAWFGNYGDFLTSSSTKDLWMIDLNIRALTIMTKLFLTDMVERGEGKIMNVASTAAFQPGPLMAVYFATKAYVLSFSEAIAEELLWTGVTITALCPGPTQSEFAKAADLIGSKSFSGRLPSSEEVAKYGFSAMMAGRRVAIHGIVNGIMARLVAWMPRSFVTKIVKKLQSK